MTGPVFVSSGTRAMRRALVVGIDYPGTYYALNGCVNDAEQWAEWLRSRRFDVTMLTNGEATRERILHELARLRDLSQPRDVLAMVYSGHGTRVRDTDGDEADGWDEALCPADLETGGLILDDDLHAVLARLRARVGFTFIADSCHSGTVSRFAAGLPDGYHLGPSGGRRGRFIAAPLAALAAMALRQVATPRVGRAPTSRTGRGERQAPPWATLSACEPHEVAYESQGPDGRVGGDFTRAALAVLRETGPTLTHGGFLRRVRERMGADRAQNPVVDGAPGVERRTLVGVPK